MNYMHTYTTIPDLIRAALGDEVETHRDGFSTTINNHVVVKEVKEQFSWVTHGSYKGRKVETLGIELEINAYGVDRVFRRVMLKDGKLDLDRFRAKYQEVLEAWKPHQAAIDAHTTELAARADIKAQCERYADAGPELVAALEFMEINWNSPFDATRAEARKKAQTAIAKTKAE